MLLEAKLSLSDLSSIYLYHGIHLLTKDSQVIQFSLVTMLAKFILLTSLGDNPSMFGMRFTHVKCGMLLQD